MVESNAKHLLERDPKLSAIVNAEFHTVTEFDTKLYSEFYTINNADTIKYAKQYSIIDTIKYDHPSYSIASVAAQQRFAAISGKRRTHFCGAYWGYGFHEDGLKSGLDVCDRFDLAL